MSAVSKTFRATLQKSPNKGGWTYVVMPGSAKFSEPEVAFASVGVSTVTRSRPRSWRSAMARQVAVKGDLRKAIGKEAGEHVTVRLDERLD